MTTQSMRKIDSRDPQWDWLFEGCLSLPPNCHIEISKLSVAYKFQLLENDVPIQASVVYAYDFCATADMVRAAVEKLVYYSLSWEESLEHRDRNLRRIQEDLKYLEQS